MIWHNFMDCLPAPFKTILILNFVRKEIVNPMVKSFHISDSSNYINVLVEHNMDKRFTYWTPIETPIIRELGNG